MTEKPIITIDNFTGSGINGILYCEGFYPDIINQKSVMAEGFYTSPNFNYSTTGFSDLTNSNLYSAVALSLLTNSNTTYNVYVDNSTFQHIYAHQVLGDSIKDGKIHTSPNTNYCARPDIIETTLGNLLFPSERYIGRGVRFTATGGSTTTIVDTTRNFVTLGYANGDKVTNLKTGIEYTITSISTTTNTNDTLNFTASGTNTTGSGDECIAWEDDRFDTNIVKATWQENQTQWVKQFKLYGIWYLFTNGNYIGSISSDESTVDATYKQLPAKHQALAMSVNNEKILVSGSMNGKGALLLWDGYSDGWNNILKVDTPIYALTEYQSGWIYVLQGNVYYTDGYQTQLMYSANNTKLFTSQSLNANYHNSLAVNQGKLLIASANENLDLQVPGVYLLDLNNIKNGFTLISCISGTRTDGIPTAIFLSNRFAQYQAIEVLGNFSSYIFYGAPNGLYRDKSLIISLTLPEERQIKAIGLNLSRYNKDYDGDSNTASTRKVAVSIGDGNRGLISRAQPKANGTSSVFTVNGVSYLNNEPGDEIYFYRKNLGNNLYAERSFIQTIADKGTTTETWTVSPAFSDTITASDELRMIRVKNLDTKTLNYNELSKEIMFQNNGGILSNKLYIEIVFFGNTNPMPLNINEIKVYGS